MSLRAVTSCAVTDPKHRYDFITTLPTHQATYEMEMSQRNELVEVEEGRNPTPDVGRLENFRSDRKGKFYSHNSWTYRRVNIQARKVAAIAFNDLYYQLNLASISVRGSGHSLIG